MAQPRQAMSLFAARSSSRLIGPGTIIILVAVLAATLALLFPSGQKLFEAAKKSHDQASLQYLKTLVERDPKDIQARVALAEGLLAAGQTSAAQHTLTPIYSEQNVDVLSVKAQILVSLLNASEPKTPKQKRLYQSRKLQLWFTLDALYQQRQQLQKQGLVRLAHDYLQFGWTVSAAKTFEFSAQKFPESGYGVWSEAGRWWLAAGQLKQAEHAWTQALAQASSDAEKKKAGQQLALIALYRQSPTAITQLLPLVRQYPDDVELMQAIAAYAFSIQEFATALEIKQRLLLKQPTNRQLRLDIAWLLEQQGETEKAYQANIALAKTRSSAQLDDAIIRLGLALYHLPEVAAALERKNQRQRLDNKQLGLWVNVLDDDLGRPKKAIQVLERQLGHQRQQRRLWRRLVELYQDTQQPEKARQTIQRSAKIYGKNSKAVLLQAQLQAKQWHARDAFTTLISYKDQAGAGDFYYWHALGELAWRNKDYSLIVKSYSTLVKQGPKGQKPSYFVRLIEALLATGQAQNAAQVGIKRWQIDHDSQALLTLMLDGRLSRRPQAIEQLWQFVQQRPSHFSLLADYWVFYGDRRQAHGDFAGSQSDYKKALTLDEQSLRAKVALLSLWIMTKDRSQLARYLAYWQDDAQNQPELQGLYASGYTILGQPKKALPWFGRYLEEHEQDYLWQLAFADTLDQNRYHAKANRVRRYALTHLQPKIWARLQQGATVEAAEHGNALSLLAAERPLVGAQQNYAWMRRLLAQQQWANMQASQRQFMVDWYAAQSQPQWARYWLLANRLQKVHEPDYQSLSYALARNDRHAIAQVLGHLNNTDADVADRVSGYERIGQRGQALSLALNNIDSTKPWLRDQQHGLAKQAVGLYAQMPQNAGFVLKSKQTQNLHTTTQSAHVSVSSPNWTVQLLTGWDQYSASGIKLNLAGLRRQNWQRLALTHRGDHTRSRLQVGHISGDGEGASINQATIEHDRQLTQRLRLSLYGHYHQQAQLSDYFQALGVQNDLGISLNYQLTQRDSVILGVEKRSYKSRWGETLGDGYQLLGQLGHSIWAGDNYQLQTYLSTSWQENNLKHALPSLVASRVGSTVTGQDFIAKRYADTTIGFTLANGDVQAAYPQVGAIRYQVNTGVGYTWFDKKLSYGLDADLGVRVLGSDELALFYNYSRQQQALSGSSQTVGLRYNYFFGK